MIVSLFLAAVCVAVTVVVFRFGPGVVARHDERLASWDDLLAGPDLVRFPATAAAGVSVGDTPRRPGTSAFAIEEGER